MSKPRHKLQNERDKRQKKKNRLKAKGEKMDKCLHFDSVSYKIYVCCIFRN